MQGQAPAQHSGPHSAQALGIEVISVTRRVVSGGRGGRMADTNWAREVAVSLPRVRFLEAETAARSSRRASARSAEPPAPRASAAPL